MKPQRPVSDSRLGRLSQLGRLAGGIGSGAISEGFRQISRGKIPNVKELLLTPGNAKRLADRLAEMRGAAMKVGQLLSMENGEVLPIELTQILARLRDDAVSMPLTQVAEVLQQAWGKDWEKRFKRFSFTPLAAASIGQVHLAELKDGQQLAIKIQYPGIRRSIDSDIDNVAKLLNLFRLLPEGMDISPLLEEAKRQLHLEADYLMEAEHLRNYSRHLQYDDRFEVPTAMEEMTTSDVLTMQYMDGDALVKLVDGDRNTRDSVAHALLDLAMQEIFDFGLLQTDPNFANYLYQKDSNKIQLLDFGATRELSLQQREGMRALLLAAGKGNSDDIVNAAKALGYFADNDPMDYRIAITQLIEIACEPITSPASYDFTHSDLAKRIADSTLRLRIEQRQGRLPPVDLLFIHRKLGGLYLLFSTLRATIPVREIVLPYLERRQQPTDRATGT